MYVMRQFQKRNAFIYPASAVIFFHIIHSHLEHKMAELRQKKNLLNKFFIFLTFKIQKKIKRKKIENGENKMKMTE